MLNIALCDDEPEQLRLTEALIREYLSDRPDTRAQVTAFSSADELLSCTKTDGSFHLYILDVLMPGRDGIRLGLDLREQDKNAVIIYLTTSPDYAVDSYLTRAFYYLLKPVKKEQLFQVLDEAILQFFNRQEAALTLKTKDGFVRLPLSCIVYTELVDRRMRYYLPDGAFVDGVTLRGSFRQGAAPLLAEGPFVMCGVSFAVNLSCITQVERTGILLSTGRRLPLPRKFYIEVKNRWLDYCLGGDSQCC